MTNLENLYYQIVQFFQQKKPDLLATFYSNVELFKQYNYLNTGTIEIIKKVTLMSEKIYIDLPAILPIAIRKHETHILIDYVSTLNRINPTFGQTFINAYHRITFSISTVRTDTERILAHDFSGAKMSEKAFGICCRAANAFEYKKLIYGFGNIARYSPGIMGDVINTITVKMSIYSRKVFMQWLDRGSDLISSNRIEEGVSFLKLQSVEVRKLLGLRYAALHDFKNVITVYCNSITGKTIQVLSTEYSGYQITAPYTNGKTIFLPPTISFFKQPGDNKRVYTAIAAHIAATLTMHTYSFAIEKTTFRRELQERYGTQLPKIMENVKKAYGDRATKIIEKRTGEIEVTFHNKKKLLLLETPLEKLFYSVPTPHFFKELFTLVENTRIEYSLSSKYEGLKDDFTHFNHFLWERRKAPANSSSPYETQFVQTLECLIQYSLIRKLKAPPHNKTVQKVYHQLLDTWDTIYNTGNTVEDSSAITFTLYNIFIDNFPVITYCNRNDIKEQFKTLYKPVYYPEIILQETPDLIPGGDKEEFEPDHAPEEIDLSSFKKSDRKAEEIRRSVEDGSLKIYQYPEYNYSIGSYEQKHCTLYERFLQSATGTYYTDTLDYYQLLHKKLKKRFLNLQPEAVEIKRKWLSGDDINLEDALDYMISIRRQATADDKIYFKKVRNVRDIVVAVLLDASSSTTSLIDLKSILSIEKDALCLLSSSLATIGDSFGIFSFYSLGRQRVFYNIVKDFHEPWNTFTQGRITTMDAFASNRDGCAIRHTTNKLLEQPEKTKLLLILSDGIPADIGYGGKSAGETSRYAIEDTRRAIKEAIIAGVVPYCITIDKQARDYIPYLYGNYHYTIISNVLSLPEKLSKLYLRLTR